jgi:hypothetical protein
MDRWTEMELLVQTAELGRSARAKWARLSAQPNSGCAIASAMPSTGGINGPKPTLELQTVWTLANSFFDPRLGGRHS